MTRKKKTGMREFAVTIPIAGRLVYIVNAESEKEAIAAAWDRFENATSGDMAGADDIEWEAFESIAEGNCCRAPYNSVEAED
jgi:hypothetical protein